jgi:CheY-like chemotaxis protein
MLVALTGYAAESDKSRALAAGFDYHLTKPLSLDKLQVILSNRFDSGLRGMV